MMNTVRNRWLLAPLAAGLIFTSACEDDATGIEDDHLDVEGFAIEHAGEDIYTYMLSDGTPPTLELFVGSMEVAIVLLDENGAPIESHGDDHDHDHDHEEELQVISSDPSILTWTAEDHDHDHDHLEFHGELNGLQEGSVTLEICVPHDDHCDFDADLPVTVTAPGTT